MVMEEQEDIIDEVGGSEYDSFNSFYSQDGIKHNEYDYDEDEGDIDDDSEEIVSNNEDNVKSTSNVAPEASNEANVQSKNQTNVNSEQYPSIFELRDKGKTTFSSDKERADYYEGVAKHNEKLFTENYSQVFLDTYSKELLRSEQDADTLIEMQKALTSGNRLEFLRQYFGEDLKQFGYDIKYSDDEINDIISVRLSQKFGEDWQDKYDVNQLKIPTSTASKIAREQAKILNELESENERFGDPVQREQAPQITPEVRQQYLDNEYQEFSKLGMPKDEYDNFINQAAEYLPKVNLKDLYKVIHFDTIISNVREKAIKEAKQEVYNEIKNGGAKKVAEVTQPETQARKLKLPMNEADFYSRKREREMKNFLN
jgi:hypothetical protein